MEYTVHAVTGGIDALGEVTLRIQEDGKTYVGHGADTDIVVASVKAYLTALNKLMANRPPAGRVERPATSADRVAKRAGGPQLRPQRPAGQGAVEETVDSGWE